MSDVEPKTRIATPTKSPTLSDVARRAGVSKIAVSTVFNNSRGGTRVSEQTRARIMDAARDIGYRRNAAATAISAGRFGCAVLLMSNREYHSSLPPRLLDGIHDGLAERGMHLTIAQMPDAKLEDDQFVPKFLKEWMADGLIINYTHDLPPRLVKLIQEHGIPSIWTNNKMEADCVFPDDFGAGKAAAERLLAEGHRRIAFVSEIDSTHYSRADRIAGYEAAMRDAGAASVVIHSLPGWGEWPDAWQEITAFIAYGDGDAHRALVRARLGGLRIPEELMVTTFVSQNSTVEDTATGLPLPCWELPHYQTGRDAVEMLLLKIAEPNQAIPPRTLPFLYKEPPAPEKS